MQRIELNTQEYLIEKITSRWKERTHYCPDRTRAESPTEYIDSWMKLYQRWEKLLGIQCTECDPDLYFVDRKNPLWTFKVPRWIAIRLLE